MDEDRNCSNCYYEWFDAKAYPCSRCIRNKPSQDLWQAKIRQILKRCPKVEGTDDE